MSQNTNKHVLVVDDEFLIRWSLRQKLAGAGIKVSEAASVRAALAFFSPGHDGISAVLLDLKLPDGNGLEVLRHIKAVDPGCRVIMMSAHGTDATAHEALEAGAEAFYSKPFNMDEIVRLVAAAA